MTLPGLGDFFIYNTTILIVASLVCYFLAWRGKEALVRPARWLFVGATLMATGACVVLMTLILNHDFNVAYVANYSSRDLELGFLISSFWAGQEGTFLLWIFYMGVMGMVLFRTVVKKYERGVMFFLSLVILSLLTIILKRSPFETLSFTPPDGNGLNPLLQNYWMVIHPPTMFVGFAACAIPFAFALTALTQRSYDDWAERSRRWTLFAWLALGVALIEGGYWAYETLGWGGFWAWDPVENSSFIPWIFLTAQIHSTFIRRKRNGMGRFGLFMVSLTFLSVLYGTFLTRSGVLADFSVHSFVDLGINNFLIAGLLFFTLLTAALFMVRWNEIKSQSSFSTVLSRSYLVTLGVVILFLGGILTLLGTSAPLLTRFTDNPSAVDLSYYQVTMNPIAIAALALLTLFPTFKWDTGVQKLMVLLIGGALAVISFVTLLVFANIPSYTYITILSLGVSALWVNGYFLFKRSKVGHIAAPYLAHVGLALLLMGATTSAGLEYGEKFSLPMGATVEAFDYNMTFTHWDGDASTQYQHIQIDAQDGSESFVATTESRMQERDGSVMRIPHVRHHLLYDLYVAPLAMETQGGEDPGFVRFEKEQTVELGGYKFTFNDFELSGHDGESQSPDKVEALVSVEHGGETFEVAPALVLHNGEMHEAPAKFDNDSSSVSIAKIEPETGSVILYFVGSFVPPLTAPPTTFFVVEVTVKPLINLFWLGSLLIFIGGGIATWQGLSRRRQAARAAAPANIRQPQMAPTAAE